ncbi:hypothetical protein FALBO_9867 [Fusarium albosuccineum]|uniref:Uncharacterized protein n=1 Tax=Fusarium albosuccineum TaxID=1237068 RepID=A0A8H4P5J8_9HYPO|nr:hypothetical protein FALBO_9867 [Fusarium albosuccineum]
MKAFFILLSLACLAVSLPCYVGTRQVDLDLPESIYESGNEENGIPFIRRIKAHLALADSTSLPAPTAATPSNAALSRREAKVILPLLPRPRPRPRRKKLDPTSLPAPTAATPSNATLSRRGAGVMLSRPKRRPKSRPRRKKVDPTSLPAPTAAAPSNAALSRRGAGVLLMRPKRPFRSPRRKKLEE